MEVITMWSSDIWRNNTWVYYLRSVSNNWYVHLTHRQEYTCAEQVTGHIKQIIQNSLLTVFLSSEKSHSNQSEDPSVVIIGTLSFGGKWAKVMRETAPFGAHHLHWSENVWAGLIKFMNPESRTVRCSLVQWALLHTVTCNLSVCLVKWGQNENK